MPTLAVNKRALFDYQILETYEAGLVLNGQEVKSARAGQINLKGAYVTMGGAEAYLTNAHISPYKKAGHLKDYDPDRPRKLLLHKKELRSLIGKLQQRGLTMVPLKVYTSRNRLKVEIGLARGKTKLDKRQAIKKREVERELRQYTKLQA